MLQIEKFQAEMLKHGIISSDETETLWEIGRRCARFGMPMAGAGAAMLAKTGTAYPPINTCGKPTVITPP